MTTLIKGEKNKPRKIGHVACPVDGGDVFVTALFERHVTAWSFARKKKLAEFETGLDFGGRRLGLIQEPQSVLFVGAWKRHGLCAYRAGDGGLLWQRADLKKVQTVSVFPPVLGRRRLGVYCEGRAFLLLDYMTGEEIAKMNATLDIQLDPEGTRVLYRDNNGVHFGTFGRRPAWTRKFDSCVHRAAIGADAVLVYAIGTMYLASIADVLENEGIVDSQDDVLIPPGTNCFDFKGKLLWTLPERAMEIAWSPQLKQWLIVANTRVVNGTGGCELIVVDPAGHVTKRADLGWISAVGFLDEARYLVTDYAQVLSLPSLRVAWQFDAPFPENQSRS